MRWMLVLLLVPLAVAQVDDGWAQAPRDVQVDATRDDFQVTSSRTAAPHDAFFLAFDRHTQELRVQHNTSGIDARLQLRGLVEFQDLDGDGAFSFGDPIVQQTSLSDLTPRAVRATTEDTGHRLEVSYRFQNYPFGDVGFSWRIVPATTAEGPLQDPTEVRMDVMVDDYPFVSDNRTHLALEMRWLQPMHGEAGGLSLEAEGIRLHHAWHGATVGGEATWPGVVSHRYHAGDDPQELLLISWPRAETIEQDLRLRFDQTVEPEGLPQAILKDLTGRWYLYLAGMVLTAALVYLPIRMRRAA